MSSEDLRYLFTERVGIGIFDGKLTEAQAVKQAREQVAKLEGGREFLLTLTFDLQPETK